MRDLVPIVFARAFMKKSNVKISYDPEADVLSWETSPRARIDYASEIGNVVVHFTKQHTPVFIEVLEASKSLKKNKSFTQRIGAQASVR